MTSWLDPISHGWMTLRNVYDDKNSTKQNSILPLSGGYYEALENYILIKEQKCSQRSNSGECNRYAIPASYWRDIVFSRNENRIEGITTQFHCTLKTAQTSSQQIASMDKHRQILSQFLKKYAALNEGTVVVWSYFLHVL